MRPRHRPDPALRRPGGVFRLQEAPIRAIAPIDRRAPLPHQRQIEARPSRRVEDPLRAVRPHRIAVMHLRSHAGDPPPRRASPPLAPTPGSSPSRKPPTASASAPAPSAVSSTPATSRPRASGAWSASPPPACTPMWIVSSPTLNLSGGRQCLRRKGPSVSQVARRAAAFTHAEKT